MNKILVVDSNNDMGGLMIKYLTRAGFDVMLMEGSAGMHVKISTMRPDLLIINAELERESGFDVCKRFRDSFKTEYIPVLLLCETDDAARAAYSGADDYFPLSENNTAALLISKVNSLLRIKNLSDQLKKQYMELEEKNRTLDAQLKMAMKVQRSLIQEYDFTHGKSRFYSRYIPAFDVGGDYYDIINIDDFNIYVLVGDVSGHGISAALLVAMLHAMARNLVYKHNNPALFLYNMNRNFVSAFEKRDSQMYACMFCAIIDTRRKLIHYSNAGHVLPLHVRKKTKTVTELLSVGTPLGMMEESYYENKTAEYEDGDILLFYTDGISDNFYKNNPDEFLNRLKASLIYMLDAPQKSIADAVIDLSGVDILDDTQKYLIDDMSLIICRM